MPDTSEPHRSEADESRDSDELAEQSARSIANAIASALTNIGGGWPTGSDGRPMALLVGGCSDKVPTIQYGNVVLGPAQMFRFTDDHGETDEARQHRIDQLRLVQRDTEFVIGVERRLLQWGLDPASKIQSPIHAQDAFSAPPVGYDGSAVADPRDATAAQGLAVPVVDPQAPAGLTPVDQPRMDTHQQNNAAPAGPRVG